MGKGRIRSGRRRRRRDDDEKLFYKFLCILYDSNLCTLTLYLFAHELDMGQGKQVVECSGSSCHPFISKRPPKEVSAMETSESHQVIHICVASSPTVSIITGVAYYIITSIPLFLYEHEFESNHRDYHCTKTQKTIQQQQDYIRDEYDSRNISKKSPNQERRSAISRCSLYCVPLIRTLSGIPL